MSNSALKQAEMVIPARSTTCRPPQEDRLVSIDVWRGVAALAVLAIHIPHEAPGGWREHPFFLFSFLADFGYLGVSLFVLISGFCIHRRTARSKLDAGVYQIRWASFWVRRFWRLYPPYLAAIAFSLILATWGHTRAKYLQDTWIIDLVCHVTLVHNLTQEYVFKLGNGAFWSLGMEEQLYGLYFVLLVVITRFSLKWALVLVCAVSVAWRLSLPQMSAYTIPLGIVSIGSWYQWPFSYWLHWVLGAVAVDAYFGNVRLPAWCRSGRIVLLTLFAAMLLNRNTWELLGRTHLVQRVIGGERMYQVLGPWTSTIHFTGELLWAGQFFCLINWALHRERCGGFRGPLAGLLAFIGRFSYSLYLTHVPVLFTLEEFLPFGSEPGGWFARYLVYSSVMLAVGYLFFQLVERHFTVFPHSSRSKVLQAA